MSMNYSYIWRAILICSVMLPKLSLAQITDFNWQPRPMQSGEIAQIVISPTNPDTMYLGVEVNSHSVYKSENGGKNWQRVHSGDHTKDVVVHPTNPDIAFYSDSQSVWRTTTGAKGNPYYGRGDSEDKSAFQRVLQNTFRAGPSETSFSSIAIASSDPNIVYTVVKGGGFFDGSGKGQLFKSNDGGKSFNELKGSYPPLFVLMVDPKNSDRLIIGSNNGIYVSEDGGQNLNLVLKNTQEIYSLDTLDGQTWFASGLFGIWQSQDRGDSWAQVEADLPARSVPRIQIARSNPNIIWVTTIAGAVKSIDGGKTWQDASGDLKSKNLKALAIHPTNPDIAFVAQSSFLFDVRSPGLFNQGQYYHQGVFKTEDGGKTWVRSDSGLIEERIIEITTHPKRPFEIWAGQQSSRGFYRSKDAGQTWSLTPRLLSHYPMRFVFLSGNDDKIALTSLHTGEAFGISEDLGVSWNIQSEQTFFDSLSELGLSVFDRSKAQGGANIHLHGLAIDHKDPKIIYAGSVHDESEFNPKPLLGAHIFKSQDGGKTWQEKSNGFAYTAKTAIHDIKVDPNDSKIIYVATTKDESKAGNGIWRSQDGGENWQRANKGMPDDVSTETIIINPQNSQLLLAATHSGLYRSDNAADDWKLTSRQDDRNFWDIEYDPTNPNIVYAGGARGVFISTDFGQTWRNVSTNLPEDEVRSIGVNVNGEIVYAGTSNHGLYIAVDSSVSDIAQDEGVTTLAQNEERNQRSTGYQPFNINNTNSGLSFIRFLGLTLILIVAISLITVLIWWRRKRTL